MENLKKCTRCKVRKTPDCFNRDKNRPSGLSCYCKACSRLIAKMFYVNNREKCLTAVIQWRDSHKMTPVQEEMRRKVHQEYRKTENYKRMMQAPERRVRQNISRQLRRLLKGQKDSRGWEGLVGYSSSDLKECLEKQFKTGMTWENYGKWHVDHIIPAIYFNLKDGDHNEIKRCWELENLQPLWAHENLIKHCKRI